MSGKGKMTAQASNKSVVFSDIEGLIQRLKVMRFNEVSIAPEDCARDLLRINSITGKFTPSPVCELWLPTSCWRTDATRKSRNEFMSAKSSEDALEFHHVRNEPSVFEVLIEADDDKPEEDVLHCCASLLSKAPHTLTDLDAFGCADILKPIFIPQLKRSVMMPERFQVKMNVQPQDYPKLGQQLDDIHSLIFGSRELCKRVSLSFRKAAKVIPAKELEDFVVVQPPLRENAKFEGKQPWLMRRR